MDHLRLQSTFKFVAISRFGDGGQLMPRSSSRPLMSKPCEGVVRPANLCRVAVTRTANLALI